MKKGRYKDLIVEIVITEEPDVLTISDDGGIDFEEQEGWGIGRFGKLQL